MSMLRRIKVWFGPDLVRSRQWRKFGRGWATLGVKDRSDWCHEFADFWEQPLLLRVLTVSWACALIRRGKKLSGLD